MVVLYQNGLSEEHKPKNFTYTEDELTNFLPDFDSIRTFRLSEVPNTWCMWGENNPIDKRPDEYNQIASEAIDEDIYSPMFFIHDTEINPDWKLTDEIIQNGYVRFKKELLEFLDYTAFEILEEQEYLREEQGMSPSLVSLEQVGISVDKRIVYRFDISKQTKELLKPNNFMEFSLKMHDFLKNYYKDGEIFVIYADKNILIEISDEQVKPLVNQVLETLQVEEKYEMCSELKNIYDRWASYKAKKATKEKKKRAPKSSKNS